ncbi:type II toxin-antitoxin system RelE/ParE family toxin [Aquibium oceanicum]|uniref:Toxin n=1 Tax=Aquibium oceanicum TaxID=1670800 RepID=A0A1L3SWV6_9HYPH|nr:type II toxin-antitoxin system RelE/ParE family toxin [Aquibium oceanicum]APH73860.1 plasmid stabilization protein [Aquibium oceanicum]
MIGYVLTRAAQADLDGIWDYSELTWSEDQAERYVAAIRDTCLALANGEKTGRPADRFRQGYYRQAIGSHFIFYKITEDGLIQVMRILHQRMDVASRLGKK